MFRFSPIWHPRLPTCCGLRDFVESTRRGVHTGHGVYDGHPKGAGGSGVGRLAQNNIHGHRETDSGGETGVGPGRPPRPGRCRRSRREPVPAVLTSSLWVEGEGNHPLRRHTGCVVTSPVSSYHGPVGGPVRLLPCTRGKGGTERRDDRVIPKVPSGALFGECGLMN